MTIHIDPQSSLHVLIVQSDPKLRSVVEDAVLELGLTGSRLDEGPHLMDQLEAELEAVRASTLLITELRFPIMSGVRILQELVARSLALPAVVMTDRLEDHECDLLHALGALHVMFKPIEPAHLRALLYMVAANRVQPWLGRTASRERLSSYAEAWWAR